MTKFIKAFPLKKKVRALHTRYDGARLRRLFYEAFVHRAAAVPGTMGTWAGCRVPPGPAGELPASCKKFLHVSKIRPGLPYKNSPDCQIRSNFDPQASPKPKTHRERTQRRYVAVLRGAAGELPGGLSAGC